MQRQTGYRAGRCRAQRIAAAAAVRGDAFTRRQVPSPWPTRTGSVGIRAAPHPATANATIAATAVILARSPHRYLKFVGEAFTTPIVAAVYPTDMHNIDSANHAAAQTSLVCGDTVARA